jgi:hypothetical protein
MEAVRRALLFSYAVVLRALVAIGGALAAYGATGMFSAAGLMPPNALVTTGVLFTLVVLEAMWLKERRVTRPRAGRHASHRRSGPRPHRARSRLLVQDVRAREAMNR